MPAIQCCKGCTKPRFVDGVRCHSKCETYAAEVAKNQKGLEQIHKDTNIGVFRRDTADKLRKRYRR